MSWFASPLVWALAALVPYAFLQVRFLARLREVPGVLGASETRLAWKRHVVRRAVASVAGGVFWVACALASAGTLSLPRYVSEPVLGAEIAFVVDVSNSMLTDDGRGQRLERAREFVARLAATADGASLSVVAFRGLPSTLCPPTRDRRAFAEALRWAGPTVTSSAGSDVGAALDEALRPVLLTGTARVIVVFSDGNDTGGQARAASSRAASAGATLAFVGFGGQKALPVADAEGRPVSGQGGQTILTALDESALRDWAAAGRGVYVRADDSGAFARVAALCSGAAKSPGKRRDVRVEVDATPALAFVAMAALGLALVLSATPHSRMGERRSRHGRAIGIFNLVLTVAFAFMMLSSCSYGSAFMVARANSLQRSGYAHEAAALYLKAGAGVEPVASYDLANVFNELGEAAPARAMYEVAIASGVAGIAARSWYNIGAASFSRGEYPEAAAAFRKALEALVPAKGQTELVHEASRAYELALKAQDDKRDSGVTERSRYGSGSPAGELQPFALSRTDEKTLFAPGNYESGIVEDH